MKCGTDDIPDSLKEYIKKATDELAKEMDFSVLSKLMIEQGWIEVKLPRLNSLEHAVDIQEWLTTNCKNKVNSFGKTFIFESAKDAEWFILRWK